MPAANAEPCSTRFEFFSGVGRSCASGWIGATSECRLRENPVSKCGSERFGRRSIADAIGIPDFSSCEILSFHKIRESNLSNRVRADFCTNELAAVPPTVIGKSPSGGGCRAMNGRRFRCDDPSESDCIRLAIRGACREMNGRRFCCDDPSESDCIRLVILPGANCENPAQTCRDSRKTTFLSKYRIVAAA